MTIYAFPNAMRSFIHFSQSFSQSIIECNDVWQDFFLMSQHPFVYYVLPNGQEAVAMLIIFNIIKCIDNLPLDALDVVIMYIYHTL